MTAFSRVRDSFALALVLQFMMSATVCAQLLNPGFESGSGSPDNWFTEAYEITNSTFTWETSAGRGGSRCVSIDSHFGNDADWYQDVTLASSKWYNCSAWIKGENLVNTGGGSMGANISFVGTWTGSGGYLGTLDWTQVQFTFQSSQSGWTKLGCRVGHWGNLVTGKAYFDDLAISADFIEPAHGEYVYLVLQSNDVASISDSAFSNWIGHLDDVYGAYSELIGTTPYGGEKIGIVSFVQPVGGWAVAGNPIKWRQQYIADELASIAADDDWSFGIMHELAHDFNTVGDDGVTGRWVWDVESWANILLLYAADTRNARFKQTDPLTATQALYVGTAGVDAWNQAIYQDLQNEGTWSWGGVHYRLLEIKKQVGWEPFKQTFRHFLALDAADVPTNAAGKYNLFMDCLALYSGSNIWETVGSNENDWVSGQLSEYIGVLAEDYSVSALGVSGTSGIVLGWSDYSRASSYSVEACTSLVNQAWYRVPPTNQWPISASSWTNTEPVSDEPRFYRVLYGD